MKNVIIVALLSLTLFAGCKGGDAESGSGGDVASSDSADGGGTTSPATTTSFAAALTLDGGAATRSGQAQFHCWAEGCWEVVWCGHAICDGSWTWNNFPHSGQFSFVWEGVNEKCAGSPPYQLQINGETVQSGEIAQWGSCSECPDSSGNFAQIFTNYDLGSYQLTKGDTVTLWAQTEFSCGINGAGAYAAHDRISVSGTATE